MKVNVHVVVSALSIAALLAAAPAAAQVGAGPASMGYKREPNVASSSLPKVLKEIGFDQNLNQQVPLDLPFVDEQERPVTLGDFFGRRPVVLALVYYDCPMLCTQVLNGLASSLGVLSLDIGKDFEVVTVSFDPREKPPLAAAKKASLLERLHRPGAAAGWHFLTGDQDSITRLTKAVGFRYVWDDSLKQFAHPTGIMVLTPQGRVARYLFGIEYGPRDLRLALVDASSEKIGTAVDQVLLFCYHYDPETGKYGLAIMRTVRIAGIATVLAIGAFIVLMVRREKRVPLSRVPPRTPRV